MKRKIYAAAFVAQLLASTAGAQTAQQVPGQDSQDQNMPSASRDAGLEDILVTARRREETLHNVPVAVTVMSREELDRRNLNTLESVAAAVPQLSIARVVSGAGSQISLRGIGSTTIFSIGVEQSVAVVVDSVYYGQGRTINEGFFDLAGLEVLKGPQALFYGKNATAGLISIRTASPGDHFEGLIRGGYEFNAKQASGELVLSGPLSDTFGVRLAVRALKQYGTLFSNQAVDQPTMTADIATGTVNSYLSPAGSSDNPGAKQLLGRLTAVWKPTDRFTATLKISGTDDHTDNPASNMVIYACASGFSSLNGTIPCARDFVIRQNFLPAEFSTATPFGKSDGSTYGDYTSWAATGDFAYAADSFTWSTILNYNRNRNQNASDLDGQSFGPRSIWATEDTTYHAFSAETRLQTNLEGPINGLIGAYYQATKRVYDQWALFSFIENSAAPDGFRYTAFAKDSNSKGKTYSVYGQLSVKPLPTVELTAGGRYIHETKDSILVHPYAHPLFNMINNPTRGYRVQQPVIGDQTWNDFAPDITLTWRPTETLTLYGSYKSAYKSGGFNNSGAYLSLGSPTDIQFDPEIVNGFEAGVKAILFDRQLRLTGSVYHNTYSDFQVDFGNPLTLSLVTLNAGKVKQKGIEADFEYAPYALPGFRLRGTVNYNRSRYGNFTLPCYSGQTPAEGCFAQPGFIPLAQDVTGRTLHNAPKWVGSLGANYTASVSDTWSIQFGADARYSSSYNAASFLTPLAIQKKYVNLDGTITLRNDKGLQFALIGKNLTNNFVLTSSADGAFTGAGTNTPNGVMADQRGFIANPRTVELQVTVKF